MGRGGATARSEAVRGRRRPVGAAGVGVAVWALLLVVANRWGQVLYDAGVRTRIEAPPVIGRFQLGPDAGLHPLMLAAPLAAVVVVAGAGRAAALPWRRLLLVAGGASVLWAVALALVSGWWWLQRPMELPGHYWPDLPKVGSPGRYLAEFVSRIDDYGTHVRAHPPGFVLLLWGLARVGLSGSGWGAALVIAGGAAAVPAALVAVREVAGEPAARRAAPFLAVGPLALWIATTPDAFFAGVGAWAVTCVVLATGRPSPRSERLALLGGVLFGLTLMLSYGLVLLGAVPLVVALGRRRWRPVAVAAAGAAVVLGLVALTGFWWVEGLLATRLEYLDSVASRRPYGYFLLANLAALGVALGPAVIAGLAGLRDRRLWLLVGGALLAVGLADVSGMSKGEVERIWLPFAVWVVPAASALLVASPRPLRGWLGAQAVFAIAVQVGVRTHW